MIMTAVWGNLAVIALLAAAVTLAARSLWKSHKTPKHCTGNCATCRTCPPHPPPLARRRNQSQSTPGPQATCPKGSAFFRRKKHLIRPTSLRPQKPGRW